MSGKLSSERLESLVLSQIQHHRADVLVHAGLGEDSAIIDFGDEVCLVSSDPITGAIQGIGELAVHVSCNDIAANGGTPVGVQVVLLLPKQTTDEQIREIMTDVHRTAASLKVEVLGGHTEITDRVVECVISATAVGRAPKERYVTSAGAQVGDSILVTKELGIEATMILGKELAHLLPFINNYSNEIQSLHTQLSVVPEGLVAAKFGVNAMHDITEGGLMGALAEIMSASNVGCEIWEDKVPISELTREITTHLKLDPLKLLSSGAMLIVTDRGQELQQELLAHNISSAIVGQVTEEKHQNYVVRSNGERDKIPAFVQDELWRALK